MSGKPYPEGVAKVLEALARADALAARIAVLEPLAAELNSAREEYAALSSLISGELDRMDLADQGNYGFGRRMGWFLAEMRRRIVAEVAPKEGS